MLVAVSFSPLLPCSVAWTIFRLLVVGRRNLTSPKRFSKRSVLPSADSAKEILAFGSKLPAVAVWMSCFFSNIFLAEPSENIPLAADEGYSAKYFAAFAVASPVKVTAGPLSAVVNLPSVDRSPVLS